MATVLVVDDDYNGNDILCRLLRVSGHIAISALRGEDALKSLTGQRVDLVILDYMMPGLNGIETLSSIRANVNTATLPVIMYTAIGDQHVRGLAIQHGANDYFAKGMMEFSDLCLMVDRYTKPAPGQIAA